MAVPGKPQAAWPGYPKRTLRGWQRGLARFLVSLVGPMDLKLPTCDDTASKDTEENGDDGEVHGRQQGGFGSRLSKCDQMVVPAQRGRRREGEMGRIKDVSLGCRRKTSSMA